MQEEDKDQQDEGGKDNKIHINYEEAGMKLAQRDVMCTKGCHGCHVRKQKKICLLQAEAAPP